MDLSNVFTTHDSHNEWFGGPGFDQDSDPDYAEFIALSRPMKNKEAPVARNVVSYEYNTTIQIEQPFSPQAMQDEDTQAIPDRQGALPTLEPPTTNDVPTLYWDVNNGWTSVPINHPNTGNRPQPAPTPARTLQNRDEENEYIIQSRLEGKEYFEIHREGGFTCAIATLRTRHRNLTKDKTERVRCPQWTPNDDALLLTIRQGYGVMRKVPWGKIGAEMKRQGASYKFAPAAVKKRYDHLVGQTK